MEPGMFIFAAHNDSLKYVNINNEFVYNSSFYQNPKALFDILIVCHMPCLLKLENITEYKCP